MPDDKSKPEEKAKVDPNAQAAANSVAVANEARARQAAKPAKALRKFEVSCPGGEVSVVSAADENEAWAKYCDGRKKWPSPKTRSVKAV